MVRQAQVDRRDPERGDDQRGNPRWWTPTRRTRRRTPIWRLQELGADMPASPMSPRPSRCGTPIPRRRREAAAGREGHPGPRLHGDGRDHQRGRRLARQPARPCLRQRPAAAISTLNLAHMIPRCRRCGRGRNGTSIFRRPRCFSARPKARPRSGFPSCRRCRPYADRRPDRRGQVRAAGADGAAVPRYTGMRRSSPSISAVRSARRRSPWAATGTISAAA